MSVMSAADFVVREIGAARCDGRRLELCEVGPVQAPVAALYLHGTGSSRLEVGPYAEVAERAGVRIVAWDRPGHGRSDPLPGRTITDVVADAAAVASAVGAVRPAVIGLSGGGTHVLALAALGAQVISRGIAINPGCPSDEPTLSMLGRGGPVPLMRLARTRPWLFRPIAAALQSPNPISAALMRRQLDPRDRRLVQSPVGPLLDEAAWEARRQRGAWVDEAAMFWRGPWGFALDEFAVPLDVFVGERDAFRPFGESLARAGATVHRFPGGHVSGFSDDTMTQIVDLVIRPTATS